MEFGKTLRAAREARGFTIAQVSETTHIMASVVEGLEKEDFSRIAAPIYGRGFVKLYCEAVGLEAKPLVDEFMAIMSGEHEISIKERPVATADEPSPAPAVATPPPGEPAAERDLFSQDEPAPAAEPKKELSRYASPFRSEARMPSDLPGLPWRLILLGIAGLAILLLLAFGVRALYRATSAEPAAEAKPAAQSAGKPAIRTPQKIPSLYID